jgi:hypothetical protein
MCDTVEGTDALRFTFPNFQAVISYGDLDILYIHHRHACYAA